MLILNSQIVSLKDDFSKIHKLAPMKTFSIKKFLLIGKEPQPAATLLQGASTILTWPWTLQSPGTTITYVKRIFMTTIYIIVKIFQFLPDLINYSSKY